MGGKCDKVSDVLAASTATTLVNTADDAEGEPVRSSHPNAYYRLTCHDPSQFRLSFLSPTDNGEREIFFGYWDVPAVASLRCISRVCCVIIFLRECVLKGNDGRFSV